MKELKIHLFEAISSGRRIRGREFPEDPDFEEIASFLEYKGFEKYDGPLILSKYSNHYDKDTYEIGFKGKLLNMYMHGDDVIFSIWLGSNADKYYGNFGDFASGSTPRSVNQVFYKTYNEFREAVMDHYWW